ncbi:LIC12162 family transferase [Candidatus Pelagibacter sp.]|uniref:LIC12162 family transferase n=1 Tax=Candidatus Pelagibacter sp. TaxID=2024849 RepID=UPI003F8630FF
MKKKLILAADEKFLNKKYLNYCISNDIYSLDTNLFKKFKIRAPHSHWRQTFKKKRDYKYLKKLYYRVLKKLVKYLNSFHEIKYDENQWHIIIGPWLNYIIPILWDRWETINIFEKKFGYVKDIVISDNKKNFIVSNDFNDFIEKSQQQAWNSEIYKSIIDFKKKWRPSYQKIKLKKNEYKKNPQNKYLIIIDKLILYIQKIFPSNKKFILIKANFEKNFYIQIFFKYFILTRFFKEFEQTFEFNGKISYKRKKHLFFFPLKKSGFENYLSKMIIRTIPASYMENFRLYLDEVKKINISSKFVLTAFKHYENDLFKVWIAKERKKLISSLHGGNIEKEFFFDSWTKYSYKYITWNKDYLNDNKINLPINFLLYRKKCKNKDYLNKNKTVFLLPHPKIKPLRLIDGFCSFEVLDTINIWNSFFKNLNTNIKKNVYWRLGPFPDEWGILEKLNNKIQNINLSKEKNFEKDVLNARLSIHVELQTTFLETMYMNIPSVVIMNYSFWNVSKKSLSILKKLKNANILFNNHKDLANHVNKYYSNIDDWWESKKVQKIRSDYLRYSGAPKSDKAKQEWFYFLKKLH